MLRRGVCGFYFETAGPQDHYGVYSRGVAIGHAPPQIVRYDDFTGGLDAKGEALFGVVAYDAKNHIEPRLPAPRAGLYPAPAVSFLRPGECSFERGGYGPPEAAARVPELPAFEPLISRERYLECVGRLMGHIQRGDVYEINYTFPFAAHLPAHFDPFDYYERRALPVPFSCFYHDEERTMLCFSPERFLQKRGRILTTEPIKGTARRSDDPEIDRKVRRRLKWGAKFRAENTMIVDLSRNDLHRVCVPGSVRVEKWCDVRSFPMLYHSVSTITGEMDEGKRPSEAFAAAFPPGSMTGAPKVRAMELIDETEKYARGWYAGAAGYKDENGDFDFNVIIRALFIYGGKIFFHVGGALTIDSHPETEYEECLTKAFSFAKLK